MTETTSVADRAAIKQAFIKYDWLGATPRGEDDMAGVDGWLVSKADPEVMIPCAVRNLAQAECAMTFRYQKLFPDGGWRLALCDWGRVLALTERRLFITRHHTNHGPHLIVVEGGDLVPWLRDLSPNGVPSYKFGVHTNHGYDEGEDWTWIEVPVGLLVRDGIPFKELAL